MKRTTILLLKRLKVIFISLITIYVLVCISLYFLQDRFIFLGEPLPEDFQFQFDSPFEEHNLQMTDGGRVNVLEFKADPPRGLIVYYHGNAGNLSRWGMIVKDFTKQGYDVAIMDYRGYGKSVGQRTQRTLLADAIEVYDFFSNKFDQRNVIVFGRSIGTGMATYVAAQRTPGKLILETPYYSFTSLIQSIVPFFPVRMALKYRFPNNENLLKVTCPIFIFHGTRDEVIPYEQGLRLSRQAQNIKMFTIEGGGHNNLSHFESYRTLLDRVLQ